MGIVCPEGYIYIFQSYNELQGVVVIKNDITLYSPDNFLIVTVKHYYESFH